MDERPKSKKQQREEAEARALHRFTKGQEEYQKKVQQWQLEKQLKLQRQKDIQKKQRIRDEKREVYNKKTRRGQPVLVEHVKKLLTRIESTTNYRPRT